MKISQKKYTSKTNFEFDEEALKYTVSDNSGARTFSVAYGSIPTETGEFESRNEWFRNVGLLWGLLGLFVIVNGYISNGEFGGSIWLTLGVICFVAYWMSRIKYTTIGTDKGNIFVIQDSDHDEILTVIDKRRKAQWAVWYGVINYQNEPRNELGKFELLLEKGAISKEEFDEARRRILEYHQLESTTLEHGGELLN